MGRGRGGELIEGIDNDYLNSIASYKHIFPKLIWTVLFSLMLALGVYCSIELVQDYMSYPSYTEISSQFTTEFHLPAITICNINRLNRTKMEADKISGSGGLNLYDLYSQLMEDNNLRSKSKGGVKNSNSRRQNNNQGEGISYDLINNMNVYRTFRWDILSTLNGVTLTFAKEKLLKTGDTFKTDLTEMGNCLEINDNQALVQKVNGPVGGLSMILDAQTEHYIKSTESEGFYVVLRMANESVISKEYAFAVSPGRETFIQLQTTEVTRLEPPYGNCLDTSDLFYVREEQEEKKEGKIVNPMTIKECFTSQVLWQFMKEPQCKCYPWYIYSRHIERTRGTIRRNIELEAQLYQYFTSDLPKEKRIEFDNITCYFQDNLSYNGTTIATFESVKRAQGCADRCKNTKNCLYFNWADSLEQCDLYGAGAGLTGDLEYRVTRGDMTCNSAMEFEECALTVETKCNNLLIDLMMSENSTQKPMECHEPCSYNKTSYTLSSSNFPSRGLWENSLADAFPHYKTFAEAQRNLVKLVFYQELMTRTEEVQTAAYNWRSFVGELGGVLDLFVGISVLTVFKILEWLLCLVWTPRKRNG